MVSVFIERLKVSHGSRARPENLYFWRTRPAQNAYKISRSRRGDSNESVGIRDAKPNLSALVRAAAKGETTLITDYGKPVALIAPLETATAKKPRPSPKKAVRSEARLPTDFAALLERLLNPPFELKFDF